ncbi:hypothetical protein F4Y19_06560 [Candidatus Poribacteria bacterium]|nr:hypothetical protein [Candidatus Poribacteria bacterium]
MQHDHSHRGDDPHSVELRSQKAESTTTDDRQDWRDNATFDSTRSKTDPWEQPHPEREVTKDTIENTNQTYPPPNWHTTEDPILRAEYLRAQLVKQFGDIPQVHTVAEWHLKMRQETPPTHEEYIEFLQAQLHLWPSAATRCTLERNQKLKAAGVHVKLVAEVNLK